MTRFGAARLNAKRDVNEPEIVEALEAVGCLVAKVSGAGVPDLIVWSPFQKRILLLEVKDGLKVASARKLKPDQVVFHAEWTAAGAPVIVVENKFAALKAVGAPHTRQRRKVES